MCARTREKDLDNIINEMVDVVEKSKDEIFYISEDARTEHERLVVELCETKEKVFQLIEDEKQLEQKVRASRKRLSEVSKYFDLYSEEEIRTVYERTHLLQTSLAMLRQQEKVLRQKRDELERRIVSLNRTIERADGLVGKVSVVLNYLNEDFKYVNEVIEEAKEKHEFGLKIIEAQEEERRKISRDIHDGPAQMLANILLRSELVEKSFRERSIQDALKEVDSVREMIRSSLYEVRRIIYDLRPMALDDLGLIPTLKKYLSTISNYDDVKIEFSTIGPEKRLHAKYEVALFRMIQEGVQNALKHANASLITVKLEITKNFVTVVIRDNGKGFDINVKHEHSFGLIGMRERVEMFDGKLVIESGLGKGTKILIQLPFIQ